jgi:hypothetical protein
MKNATLTSRVALIRAPTPFCGALHCQPQTVHFSFFITGNESPAGCVQSCRRERSTVDGERSTVNG